MKAIAGLGSAARTPAGLAAHRAAMSGPRNHAWKGGVVLVRSHGNYKGARYVRCPDGLRSMSRKDGYLMEHRMVVALAIGRTLERVEAVHHRDHNPANNAVENLMLFACNRDHKLYEWHGLPLPIWSGASCE